MNNSENKTLTGLIEEKLGISSTPDIIKEVILKDLAGLILERSYIELVMSLSEDEGRHALLLLEENKLEELFSLFSNDEEKTKKVTAAAESVIDEFLIHMNEEA